eukprot:COSAG02_NODE_2_length_75708_cov_87.013953_25_plen_56_part_00
MLVPRAPHVDITFTWHVQCELHRLPINARSVEHHLREMLLWTGHGCRGGFSNPLG